MASLNQQLFLNRLPLENSLFHFAFALSSLGHRYKSLYKYRRGKKIEGGARKCEMKKFAMMMRPCWLRTYICGHDYVAVRCLCRFSAHLLVAGQYGIAIAIATAIETWWCTGMRKCELFLGFDQISSSQRSSAQRSSFVPIIDASSGHIAYIYIYIYVYISIYKLYSHTYVCVYVCAGLCLALYWYR